MLVHTILAFLITTSSASDLTSQFELFKTELPTVSLDASKDALKEFFGTFQSVYKSLQPENVHVELLAECCPVIKDQLLVSPLNFDSNALVGHPDFRNKRLEIIEYLQRTKSPMTVEWTDRQGQNISRTFKPYRFAVQPPNNLSFQKDSDKNWQHLTDDYAYFMMSYEPKVFQNVFGIDPDEILDAIEAGTVADIKTSIKHFTLSDGTKISSTYDINDDTATKMAFTWRAWRSFLNAYFGPDNTINKPLRMVLLGSTIKKYFPPKGQMFNREHVNSGLAFSKHLVPSILLYRSEEFQKVSLHELVHMHVLSRPRPFDEDSTAFLGMSRVEETFCETMAVLGNSALNVLNTGSNDELTEFLETVFKETQFSLIQSAKILILSGYQTYAQFTANLRSFRSINTSQATLEYHLYKALVLLNLNTFLPVFSKETDNYILLDPMIADGLRSAEFSALMEDVIVKVKANMEEPTLAELMTSGRMTIS